MNPSFAQEIAPMRLVVADGRPEVRSALRLLLEQDGGTTVSSEVSRAEELLEKVRTTCPDAILLDCNLSGLQLNRVIPQLRSIRPGVRVVALCSRPEMREVALASGADAFVCKTDPPEKLLAVLGTGLRLNRPAKEGRRRQPKHEDEIGSPRESNSQREDE